MEWPAARFASARMSPCLPSVDCTVVHSRPSNCSKEPPPAKKARNPPQQGEIAHGGHDHNGETRSALHRGDSARPEICKPRRQALSTLPQEPRGRHEPRENDGRGGPVALRQDELEGTFVHSVTNVAVLPTLVAQTLVQAVRGCPGWWTFYRVLRSAHAAGAPLLQLDGVVPGYAANGQRTAVSKPDRRTAPITPRESDGRRRPRSEAPTAAKAAIAASAARGPPHNPSGGFLHVLEGRQAGHSPRPRAPPHGTHAARKRRAAAPDGRPPARRSVDSGPRPYRPRR